MPSIFNLFAALFKLFLSISVRTIFIPCSPSAFAIEKPIPSAPPVTTAVLLLKFDI